MGQLNLGVFWGYKNDSDYGKFNVLFNYTANGPTLSNMSIKLSKTVANKYTTNSYTVDSVKVAGTSFSFSPTTGDLSGYTTVGGGPQINLSGTITVSGTSAAIEIKMHRTGQAANAQVFTGTISGLATAPTGLSCSVSNVTETSVTLSGSYSSNGGSEVTSSGYQYKLDGGSWSNCSSSVTGLSPTKKYYFRYYATNIVGTTYSNEVSATMYDYPKPTTMENFLIGNGPRITLSNPLRRSVTLQILQYSTNTVLGTYTGNYDGVIQSEFATSSAVDSQYASIPNSKSGKYYCKVTYSNISTKTLGESGNYTYSIKEIDAEYPTFNSSYITNITNGSSHTGLGDSTKFIKGYNNLKGSITPMTLNKHANGDKYNISSTGLSTSITYGTSSKSFTLGNITTKTFTVTAIDKRGLSRTVNIDLGSNFIDYFKPYIQNGTIIRQNGVGTAAIISFSGKFMYWSGLSVNNKIVKIRYKIDNGSFKNLPSNASLSSDTNGNWTLSATLSDNFDVSTKYNIYLEITDQLGNVASGAVTTSSAYQLGTADALLWRDLANKRLGIRTKPNYTLDVNGTIHGNEYITNHSSGPWYTYCKIIDLTNLNASTYYPITSNNGIPNGGFHRTMVAVQLNSGTKPSWSTHNSGFTLNIDVLSLAGGWGTTDGQDIILKEDYRFANVKPGWYDQLTNSSKACFYLLGGGKYFLYTDWNTEWTINTSSTTYSSETVAPTTTVRDSVGDKIAFRNQIPSVPTKTSQLTNDSGFLVKSNLLNYVYPVGSIYMSTVNTSPASFLGGTWEQLKNGFLYGGTSYGSGNGTGTSTQSHTLTVSEIPSHGHAQSWAGNDGTTNNLVTNKTSGSQSSRNTFGTGSGCRYNAQTAWHNSGATIVGTGTTGGGGGHSHGIPYISVFMWRRTA